MPEMTFSHLQQNLERQATLQACAAYIADNALDIRTLFYDGSLGDSFVNPNQKFEAEAALITLLNGVCGDEVRAGRELPPEVEALLIYFISLFERTSLHYLISRIVNWLPSGPLRSRASAMWQYKFISRSSIDYVSRFKGICEELSLVCSAGSLQQKAQCEDLAVEYFCSAVAPGDGIGENNRTALLALFTAGENTSSYPFLASRRIVDVLGLSREHLALERAESNVRIAEAFYDEAALLLPLPPLGIEAAICEESGRSHDGHCPSGLHVARQALAERFPTEFRNTSFFVSQSLTATAYIDFTDMTRCMRYFRQYMPLHMPQVEKAVLLTLEAEPFIRRRLHVVDIGGGPGTLYVILASLLNRGLCNHAFDVTLIEPSADFHTFFEVIADHVEHTDLTVRGMQACISDAIPSVLTDTDVDWFFIGNAITPMVRGAGSATEAVDRLLNVIRRTRRDYSPTALTICENTNSVDYPAFCTALRARGLEVQAQEMSCNGDWLAGCTEYYVSPRRLTRPVLKFALVKIPAGVHV